MIAYRSRELKHFFSLFSPLSNDENFAGKRCSISVERGQGETKGGTALHCGGGGERKENVI
jgi:hypothetical protein